MGRTIQVRLLIRHRQSLIWGAGAGMTKGVCQNALFPQRLGSLDAKWRNNAKKHGNHLITHC